MICHLSLGINVSMVIILLIFGVLFSLPLKLLLNTDYGTCGVKSDEVSVDQEISVDFRSLKLCRNFEYQSTMKSVFFDSYDGNCTHVKLRGGTKRSSKIDHRKSKLRSMDENAGFIGRRFSYDDGEKNLTTDKKKSLSIAGHILAVMLIGSAIAALVEVLRARFLALKGQRPDNNPQGRRSSLVDYPQRRHIRKDTIQAQKSFEIQGMMHRSPLRLIAARPPPLLRRSSFPAQCLIKKEIPVLQTSTTGVHGRLSRRPSFVVDSDDESNCLADFRRHSRLIRRH